MSQFNDDQFGRFDMRDTQTLHQMAGELLEHLARDPVNMDGTAISQANRHSALLGQLTKSPLKSSILP